MKSNLIKAAIAAGVSVGLAFPGVASADAPTGEQGFFVPGVGGSTNYQDFASPNLAFPIHTVDWDRNVFPVNGFSSLDSSVALGVAELVASIKENGSVYNDESDTVHILCYGTGCVVAHKVKPAFEEGGDLEQYKLYEVTGYRDASNADGGILTKVLDLPGYTGVNQDDYQDATYETTIVHEYDIVADAPDKFGVLAFLNSLAAAHYYGDKYTYEELTGAVLEGRVVATITTDDQNGTTRAHYLITHDALPLTRPLRDFFLAINDDAGDVRVNELFDGLDDKLRPFIDSKYDKGPNPEVNQREESTVNGAPVNTAARSGSEEQLPADDDGEGQTGDSQMTSRSGAQVESVNNGADSGVADDSVAGDPGGSVGTPGDEVTDSPPVKKPTWKERMAERKAKRDAAKAEKREAKQDAQQQNTDGPADNNAGGTPQSNGPDAGANDNKGPAGGGSDNGSNGGDSGASGGNDGSSGS